MKKRLKSLGIPALVMFALAVVLLGGGVVGSTRAAVNYVSEVYSSTVEVPSIGVTLLETDANGHEEIVGYRDYSASNDSNMTAGDYNDDDYSGWNKGKKDLLSWVTFTSEEATQDVTENDVNASKTYTFGDTIDEKLAVKNTGTIPIYVRAIVYRYWTDSNGKKVQELDPENIRLDFNEEEWEIDETITPPTKERTVLYYTEELGVDKETPPFLTSVKIFEKADDANKTVTVTENDYTITYSYKGMKFNLEVAVEAVQAENGKAAIKSAWGIDAAWANVGDVSGNGAKTGDATTTE